MTYLILAITLTIIIIAVFILKQNKEVANPSDNGGIRYNPFQEAILYGDLNYMSESDHTWSHRDYNHPHKAGLSVETLASLVGEPEESTGIELKYDSTMQHWINTQPQQKEYQNLSDVLKIHMENPRIFRFSPSFRDNYNMDIFIAGWDSTGNFVVLDTSGTET